MRYSNVRAVQAALFPVVLVVFLSSCSDSLVPSAPPDPSGSSMSVDAGDEPAGGAVVGDVVAVGELGGAEPAAEDDLACMGGESLLLLQDNVPWGVGTGQHPLGANVTELVAQGAGFCLAGSAALASMDLGSFSTVVISAAQVQSFYDALFPGGVVHPGLTSFVEGGGVLVANLTDVAAGPGNGGSWAGRAFVGGLRRVTAYRNDNSIADAAHPIITAAVDCPSGNCAEIRDVLVRQDLDNWFHSSHGYFTDLPAGSHVILTQPDATLDGQPEPILIEYPVGEGRVVASMVTAEQRYASNLVRSLKLLANELAYAISISRPVEAPPMTASERISAMSFHLDDLVEAGELDKGNANSLSRKLMAAGKSLEAGRPHTAANQVRAFMHEVEALVEAGRLSGAAGEVLLTGAAALIETMLAEEPTP